MSLYLFYLEVHFSSSLLTLISFFKVHTIKLVSYLDDEEYKQTTDIVLKSKLRVREYNKILFTLILEKKNYCNILQETVAEISEQGYLLLLLRAFSGVETNQLSLVTNQDFCAHS
jgi:hypothetical protein